MRVLALDVGSSSARALAYDERGREVEGTLARRAYEPVYRSDGSAELDPDLLVTAAREALDEAAAALGGAAGGGPISCFWPSPLPPHRSRPPRRARGRRSSRRSATAPARTSAPAAPTPNAPR